jgi:CheY-like chemotaxis protein
MKILVIDDDPVVREVLTRLLETHGYQVFAAADGAIGAAIFRIERPDLILTDMVMPRQEGIETIRLMRRERPAAKIIAMSGDVPDAGVDLLADARQLGVEDIIRKPVVPAALLALVARLAEAP